MTGFWLCSRKRRFVPYLIVIVIVKHIGWLCRIRNCWSCKFRVTLLFLLNCAKLLKYRQVAPVADVVVHAVLDIDHYCIGFFRNHVRNVGQQRRCLERSVKFFQLGEENFVVLLFRLARGYPDRA